MTCLRAGRRRGSSRLRARSVWRASARSWARCACNVPRVFSADVAEVGAERTDVAPDLDVLTSALRLDRAADLDVAVAGAVESEGVDAQATRWGRVLAGLPPFLYEGVLGALECEYRARGPDILASPWSQDWAQWDDLAKDVRGFLELGGEECLAEEYVLESVRRRLRAHAARRAEFAR